MPDGVNIEIKGLAELKAKLEDLGTKTAERCIRTALRAGAEIEREAVASRAPERPDLPSGTALPPGALANDIVVKVKRSDQGNISAIVTPDKLTAHAANWVEYGHRLVEGGRSRVNAKTGKTSGPGKEVGNVAPHPFIRPAFEATRDEVTQTICTTLASEIEKASKSK